MELYMYASWLYFLEDGTQKIKIFIYGITLPSQNNTAMSSKPRKIAVLSNGMTFNCYFSNQDLDLMSLISTQQINFQNLNRFVGTSINYFQYSQVIQNKNHYNLDIPSSPTASSLKMNIYYTNDFFEYNNGFFLNINNRELLLEILRALENDTNQPFTDGYSKRLGCYEYATGPDWIEEIPPFKISKNNKYYEFERNICECSNIIHLKVYSLTKEVLLDECHFVTQDQQKFRFSQPITNDCSFEYWVFSEDGNLLHYEFCYWILSIDLSMISMDNNIKLKYGKNRELSIPIHHKQSPIKIKYPEKNSMEIINSRQNFIYNMVKPVLKSEVRLLQKHFSKEQEDKKTSNPLQSIVDYLNAEILFDNSTVYFIDPFISKESIIPILGINVHNIKVIIISAWKNNDPDEDPEIAYTKEIEEIKNGTLAIMQKDIIRKLPVKQISWYNLREETFHDRYIYIKSDNLDVIRIFAITNSLNNLLKRYDLSIFEYDEENKRKLSLYLDRIIGKCCIDNCLYPKELK